MEPAHTILLVGLIGVALLHTRSRIAGAFGACAWCVGAAAFGAFYFAQGRDPLVFLGLQSPPWLYFAFMAGLFTFNAGVIARALRRRSPTVPPAGTGPTPSGS